MFLFCAVKDGIQGSLKYEAHDPTLNNNSAKKKKNKKKTTTKKTPNLLHVAQPKTNEEIHDKRITERRTQQLIRIAKV